MSKKILSVGGNSAFNYLLKTIIEEKYKLICAPNVFEAVQQLKVHYKIPLLIIDVDSNPEENLQFLQHIKTSRLYNCFVISFLSKQIPGNFENKLTGLADVIFAKPFDPIELLMVVKDQMVASQFAV